MLKKQYPKISIVTPSYNQGQFIEQTILSIINQGYPNVEYIIIDGGSTDNTVEIIKKYEQYIDYWVSEKDNGQTEAIIKGLKKCTGELFNWINSDDMLAKDSLWNIGNCYLENPKDIVTGITINIDSHNKELSRYSFDDNRNYEDILFLININQPGSFWRTEIVKELGLNPNLRYVMDMDLMLRYLDSRKKIELVKINKPIAYYRYHKNSKTVNESLNFDLEEWALYSNYFEDLIKNNSFLTAFNTRIGILNFDFQIAKYFPKFENLENNNERFVTLIESKLLITNCLFFNIFNGLGKDLKFAKLELRQLIKVYSSKNSNELVQLSMLKLFQRNKLINFNDYLWSLSLNHNLIIWKDFLKTFLKNIFWKIR